MTSIDEHDAEWVFRGGSSMSVPADALVSDRERLGVGFFNLDLGFRIVRRRSALERLVDSLREEVTDEQQG